MKAMPAPTKPFRGLPKRLLADHFVEPEYTIPTNDQFTNDLDEDIHALKYDPRVHVEGVKQWVNETRPVRHPFEGDAATGGAAVALSDSLPVHCDSAPSVSAADTDALEEEWRRREFERAYAQLAHQHDLHAAHPAKAEAHRIHNKVARYRRAFLKGFYEARIRRIEANKWLYERLHVNADHIKEKYRQLMYASEPQYLVEPPDTEVPTVPITAAATALIAPAPNAGDADLPKEPDKEEAPVPTEQRTCDRDINELDELEADAASVYSCAPERDAILLQDIHSPPHIRGFGHDQRKCYDPKLRMLHLEHWVSPDIECWMNERKLNAEAEEASDGESEYGYQRRHAHYDNDNEEEGKPPKDDLKYEEIRGATELPTWLGPKKLDKQELDLENFGKALIDDGEVRSLTKDEKDERKAPVVDGNEHVDDAASEGSKAVSDTPSKGLLRQLVQSQSKEYYKLWYATHDTYNTTPFLEARLQRLMREIFGRREWTVYCDYLKEKQHEKHKRRMREMGPQPQ